MYSSTLQALFALYRRVRVGGYIIVDDYGHWPQCAKAIDDFFVDANIELARIDYTGRWFQKKNVDVRVPEDYETHISQHPNVLKAWRTLRQWHRRTGTRQRYFGNGVQTNTFQTYRYTEAVRRTIQKKKSDTSDGSMIRVNVCETGFNGGHSAQLFMAFQEPTVKIHYYGWDLKQVGASLPVAAEMQKVFGDQFTITWGDSKETLKTISTTMANERCDIVVVDGEHSKEGVRSDLNYLLPYAKPGAVVFGDDCAPYKRTVPESEQMKEAFFEYVDSKQIISVANYRNIRTGSPGFVEGIVPNSDGSFTLGI